MAGPADLDPMRRAIDIARPRVGLTGENPAVGCVIVQGGVMVGQAATARGGRPHAEEQALDMAGASARGAVAYVTLEPCGARSAGGRSCAERLVEAGVVRVVIACDDPSPFASGRGLEHLVSAGLTVESGVLAEEASSLYAGYTPPPRT